MALCFLSCIFEHRDVLGMVPCAGRLAKVSTLAREGVSSLLVLLLLQNIVERRGGECDGAVVLFLAELFRKSQRSRCVLCGVCSLTNVT